jgi:hypothetical protein
VLIPAAIIIIAEDELVDAAGGLGDAAEAGCQQSGARLPEGKYPEGEVAAGRAQ